MSNKVDNLEYSRYIIIGLLRETRIFMNEEVNPSRFKQLNLKHDCLKLVEDLILKELQKELK